MEKKKPEIRFNGFEGEWATTTLGDIAVRVVSKNEDNCVTLPLTISAQYGLISQTKFFNSRIAAKDVRGYYVIKKGEFAYNRSTSDFSPFGAVKRLDGYKAGVLSTLYIVFRLSSEQIHSNYLVNYFSTSNWHQHIAENAAEGARNHGLLNITAEDFFKTPIKAPIGTEEQEKIASFLTTLDKLIAKLEAKLDKLRKLKQALLEKMFANINRGDKTPEIRFKGYTDKWQVKELREVATKHSISNQHVHHQNLLSLSYGKIKRKDINSNKGLLPASFDTYQMVKEGVVVMRFTDLQNDKKSLRVGLAKEEGIISPAYVCIYGKESINADFLYQELHYYDSILKLFYSMGDGMRQTLSYTDITTMPISTPQMEEQKKIVDLYNTFDRKITQTSTKLTKLRNIKQSLLQKMFA